MKSAAPGTVQYSFIIPTRSRPASLQQLCASIVASTRDLAALEVILVVDTDDRESLEFSFPGLHLRKVAVSPGASMGALNMAGYRASSGRYVMLMNDDVTIRTAEWDRRVGEVLARYPDGMVLVHVNDLLFGDRLCTFPLLSREFCELAGGVCPEGYRRYGIDNHIQNVFELLALRGHHRRVFLPDVLFEHSNVTETPGGAHYVPNAAIHAADMELLAALHGERQALAARMLPPVPHTGRQVTMAEFDTVAEINAALDACPTPYLVAVRKGVQVSADALLRAMEPGVGVATAAGLMRRPDFSGRFGALQRAGAVETLDAGAMLIDAAALRGLRLDESYGLRYAGIDFGLRVWEQCFRVVCAPGPHVPAPDSPADGQRFVREWLESGRIDALDRLWRAFPELVEVQQLKRAAAELLHDTSPADEFIERARPLLTLPAIRGYLADQASDTLGPRPARADDPLYPNLAVLLGLLRQPVLYQRGVYGHNIVLNAGRFYAVPGDLEKVQLPDDAVIVSDTPADLRQALASPWLIAQPPAPLTEPRPQGGGALEAETHTEAVPILYDVRTPVTLFRRAVRALPYLNLLHPSAGVFDPEYYRRTYPELAGRSPLLHFILAGAFEGCRPHPLFDPAFYFWKYPDVRQAHVNPLGHYLRAGVAEQRQPHPLFDGAFYLAKYPEVRGNPLVHYIRQGAKEGRQPHPWFLPEYYLERCPAARAAANPLIHFLEAAPRDFVSPHPRFDPEYHLRQPGVYINPLLHFVLFGDVGFGTDPV